MIAGDIPGIAVGDASRSEQFCSGAQKTNLISACIVAAETPAHQPKGVKSHRR
jgi:hypothetical protein